MYMKPQKLRLLHGDHFSGAVARKLRSRLLANCCWLIELEGAGVACVLEHRVVFDSDRALAYI